MRRPFHLTCALLAVVTAVALIGSALAVRPPGLPAAADGPREAANRAVAHAFYAAANAAIATGDLAPLTALVAPDLLDGGGGPGAGPGPVGLRRRLLALHATAPTLRLSVGALAVDGNLAVVQVALGGGGAGAFLGLALREQPVPWGPVDVLRVAGGRVVELQGDASATGLLEPALAVPFAFPTAAPSRFTVHRVTIAPGARHVAEAVGGPRLLYLEAGTLTVEVVATGGDARPAATVKAGERLAVPAGVAYTAQATGDAPAALLDLAVAPLGQAAPPPVPAGRAPDDGVAASLLADSLSTALPVGPGVVALGWATLAPGARLAWAEAPGPVLVHAEAGAAHPDPSAGFAWVADARGRPVALGNDALAAGNGAFIAKGNPAVVRAGADAPATLLIVALLPAAAAPPTDAPRG